MKICWNITSKCNFMCKHCFRELNEEELTLEANKKILDKLVGIVDTISFSGGEVLLYKDFDKLINYACQLGFECSFTTNATLLNEENLDKYLKSLNKISLSLDFLSDEKNELFNRGKGYAKMIENIVFAIRKKFPNIFIKINTVCMQQNIYDLLEIHNFIDKLPIDSWKILRFTPLRNNAIENEDFLAVNDNQFKYVKEQVSKFCDKKIIVEDSQEIGDQIVISPSGNLFNYKDLKETKLLSSLQGQPKEVVEAKLIGLENQNQDVNLNLYKTFYDVAKAGSINGASKNTYISQPAISKAIKKMEDELGVKLFVRNSSGVSLTNNGEKLFYYIEAAFNNLTMARRSIKEDKNFKMGSISIGVPSHIASFFLLDRIKEFHEKYPNISITIISRASKELMELLRSHIIDFVIDTSPLDVSEDKSIIVKKIAEVEHCFFVKKGTNKIAEISSLEDLSSLPVILPVPRSVHRKSLEKVLDSKGIKFNNIMSIENSETIIQAVNLKLGIGYVIKDLIDNDENKANFEIIKIKDQLPKITLNLIYFKNYLSVVPKRYINEYILNGDYNQKL